MSADNANGPERPKPPRGGFLPLALAAGLVFLYLVGLSMLPVIGPMGPHNVPLATVILYWGLFVGFVALAVVLAVWRKTSRTGTGMLIAFGIWILLGGEVCVGVLVQMRQA